MSGVPEPKPRGLPRARARAVPNSVRPTHSVPATRGRRLWMVNG
jgi:hypothetical protein